MKSINNKTREKDFIATVKEYIRSVAKEGYDIGYDKGFKAGVKHARRLMKKPKHHPPQSPAKEMLFLIQEGLSQKVWDINEAEKLGGQKSYQVNGVYVDPKSDGNLDLNKLEQYITGKYPMGWKGIPEDFHGYAMLDLENPYMDWLREPPESDNFKKAQENMILAINKAREIRPDIKWGYYAIPNVLYWIGGNEPGGPFCWHNAPQSVKDKCTAQALAPVALYDACDYLSPSIYDHYPDALLPAHKQLDKTHMKVLIDIARTAAKGKPVLPFITHRFYNGDAPYSYSLVPPDEFKYGQLTAAKEAGADGVIWWGADPYWFCCAYEKCNPDIQEMLKKVFDLEVPEGVAWKDHLDALHEKYLRYCGEVLFAK